VSVQIRPVGLYQYFYQSRAKSAHQICPAGSDPPSRSAIVFFSINSQISRTDLPCRPTSIFQQICNFTTSPTSLGLLTYDRSAPHFHLCIDPPRPANSTNPTIYPYPTMVVFVKQDQCRHTVYLLHDETPGRCGVSQWLASASTRALMLGKRITFNAGTDSVVKTKRLTLFE